MESLTSIDSVCMWPETKESGWCKDNIGSGLCLDFGGYLALSVNLKVK